MKKAVIYARVSTEGQEEQKTIQSQLAELRQFAKSNSYEIIDEYIDNGWSGGSLARPELDRLRDDIKNGCKFETVLIHHPDRLSRKYIQQGLVIEEMQKKGTAIIFINRPNTSDSLEDRLLLGVEGLFAEYEKEKILERTRRGKLHKARNGHIVTSRAPYGYTYIKKRDNREGYLKVNNKEADVVKLIFSLFTEQLLSVRGVNRELLNRGVLPRRGAKTWAQSTLHRILRSETYIGQAYYNKHYSLESPNTEKRYKRTVKTNRKLRDKTEWIPITVPDIIDKDIFSKAQMLLVENSSKLNRERKYNYLLTGLIRCGECGSTYSGECCHHSLFYRCSNRHNTFPLPKECNQKMAKANELENIVWETVESQILNPKIISKHIEMLSAQTIKGKKKKEKELDTIKEELGVMEDKRRRLIDVYSDGDISKDDFINKKQDLDSREKNLEDKQKNLEEQLSSITNKPIIKKGLDHFCKLAQKRLAELDFNGRKTFLRFLINSITLEDKKVKIQGVIPVSTKPFKTNKIRQKAVSGGILSPTYWYWEQQPTLLRYEIEVNLVY
jgi:site-specific DNA recombinase